MDKNVTSIAAGQTVADQPSVGANSAMPETSQPILSQDSRKTNVLWSGFFGALLAAVTMAGVNAWIVPTVARHHKRIDRMYQAMFDTTQSAGLLYGYTWNVWNERQRLVGATNKPLEDLQQVEAKARALAFQLPLIFDASIATNWNTIIDGYCGPNGIVYPITHREEFPILATGEKMNEKLNPLTQLAEQLVTRMQNMIREIESRPWWRVVFLGEA